MTRAAIPLALGLIWAAICNPAAAQTGPLLADPAVAEAGKLIVLTAKRGDVDIAGFGKVTGAYLYRERFSPERNPGTHAPGAMQEVEGLLVPVWHIERGEKLRITLRNELGGDGALCDDTRTNLHTHGLLVGPWTTAQSPFAKLGDFVLTDLLPASCQGTPPSVHAHGAPLGPAADYEILIPHDHPSGLFWYHPHSHGLSGRQVGGGMAGLIAVGKLSDYAQIGSGARHPAIESHYLTLKDMQVRNVQGSESHAYVEEPKSTLCADSPDPEAARQGRCTSKDGAMTWLFPVNGQLHPHIPVRPAGQVWRLGNTSPSVTYRLALQAGDDALCMQVLARDGVPVVQSGQTPSTRIFESEIILMPGSRVELYASYDDALNLDGSRHTIRGTPCGRRGPGADASSAVASNVAAELTTLGFDTGSNPPGETNPVGDPWPPIQLASVLLERRPQVAASAQMYVSSPARAAVAAASLRQRVLQPQAPRIPGLVPFSAVVSRGCGPDTAPESKADPAKGEVRVVWFAVDHKKREVPADAQDRNPAAVKIGDPDDSGTFELATEIRDAVGQRVFPAGPVELQEFSVDRTDICLRAGHREIWRLVNLSDEIHNFHIHQSKFRVLTVHDPFDQLRHEAPWALSPDQAHDVYPVPKYGYVDIEIGFAAPPRPGAPPDPVDGLVYTKAEVGDRPLPVQVGRFVFHCHILEHEDGGMMGVIEVLPPG